MLGVNKYDKAYIDACRRQVDRQIAAYKKLKGGAELEAFEPLFFNHMLLALDHYFMHRLRGQEKRTAIRSTSCECCSRRSWKATTS